MAYWAAPVLKREQTLLFYPTLDESVTDDHPVRELEAILSVQDWSAWEIEYDGARGQPPIHPKIVAAVILYGLMRSVRSSRALEYHCGHNIDYMWLCERRTIDHTTICKFRTRFKQPLKELFRQLGKLAIQAGLVRLVEVALDGTRIKANASRCHTWTAERVEAALKELEKLFEEAMAATEQADAAGQCAGAAEEGALPLPPERAAVEDQQTKLRELLKELQAADAARQAEGIDPKKNPAQIPKTDTDSKVMPNKEGGYAPNYTPLAAPDTASGYILDCDVIAEPREDGQTLATVDRIEENYGQKPERFLADVAHGTGENLAGMETRDVEFYTPVESSVPGEGNPAKRDDPQQPVAAEEWAKLPRNGRKRLAKSSFVYDVRADCYYCPLGKLLKYEETKKEQRGSGLALVRIYRCRDCEGCPLAASCRDPKAKRGRSISRDQHEPLRERMAERMNSAEGKATYRRRMHSAETPFGYIKRVMGVRQFLLRGLEKVRTEWMWVCLAYNLKKLLGAAGQLRAASGKFAMEAVS
jgi:transposase